MSILLYVVLSVLAMNLLTFILMGEDNRRRRKYHYVRRVPESLILILSALGGAFGTWVGMVTFNHKQNKERFMVLIPLFILGHFGLIIYFVISRWR